MITSQQGNECSLVLIVVMCSKTLSFHLPWILQEPIIQLITNSDNIIDPNKFNPCSEAIIKLPIKLTQAEMSMTHTLFCCKNL